MPTTPQAIDPRLLARVHGGQQPVINNFEAKHDFCKGMFTDHHDREPGDAAYSAYMTGCLLRDPAATWQQWLPGLQPPPHVDGPTQRDLL
jgi:hypothetical protein